MASLTEIASALLAKLKASDADLSGKLSDLQKRSEKLSKAAQELGESWSGSALGYHSELHFGNFEKPPLGARFSPEWGGMNGLPDGWRPRTANEVRESIEKLADTPVSNLEEDTAAILAQAKALHSE